MSDVVIARGLEVLPNNTVIVPGCEPTSAVSSITLMSQQRQQGLCSNVVVQLRDIIAAIPGVTIQFGSNFGAPRKRWLILPPFDPEACPCPEAEDWFTVLAHLAKPVTDVEDKFATCDVIGMGMCPSPDFRTVKPPEPDPYWPEGTPIQKFTTP